MARVVIAVSLKEDIKKTFKHKAATVFRLMEELEEHPKKGKLLSTVKGIAVKELRYESFRFYFITDAYKVKFLSVKELQDLFIKFIRMSNKNEQQKVIEEIKQTLQQLGKY